MRIERPLYLKRLIQRQNNGMAKVITGIRRCGKSYLLFNLFQEHLLKSGVPADHIIGVDLDGIENAGLRDARALYDHIKALLPGDGTDQPIYVFIDEIQYVEAFADVVNGLMRLPGVDVYITGSNSRFLSTDVLTEFRGRGDEVRVRPLSFSEYLPAHGGAEQEAWEDYYTFGGMPLVLAQADDVAKMDYLGNLFSTVYLRDICDRYSLRHVGELDSLVDVLASATGSLTNPHRLENTFRSVQGSSVTDKTLAAYIDHLEDAFLIEGARQYDVRGRRHIGSPRKYYFTDVGLRNARLGFREQDENHIMENVIFNELRVRGYSVDVGVVDVLEPDGRGGRVRKRLEIDFVARRGNDQCYIQSAFELPTAEKENQERRSLVRVGDSFRKYVIVGSSIKCKRDADGIVTMGLLDFLLDDKSLER